MSQLYTRSESGRYRVASPSEVCERASGYVFDDVAKNRPDLSSPQKASAFLKHQAGIDHEQFGIVYLSTRHRAIKVEVLFTGTINGASIHPREVIKAALRENAAAVILFHNHPSGIAEPSHADEMITKRLKEALALIDVNLLDHLIVAGHDSVSLAERGLV